jgi:iron complex outermembrane receptor protein
MQVAVLGGRKMTDRSYRSIPAWGSAVLATCAIHVAFGQQATTSTSTNAAAADTQLDEVVVTGLRRSIEAALESKRDAGNIVDVVNAEDIGKLPDQNVAESLGRISGVNIARKDGEGSNFTVRGLSLNRVEINGRSFVGATQDATPALETVNPEILSGIEVIKSPSADLVEGAIGATVNLKTRRPLDDGRDILSARGQLVYADIADKTGYRGSGLISQSFDDGNFGALLGLAYARIYARGEGLTTNSWVRTNAIDGNGDGINDPGLFRPNRISSQIESRKDDRSTATGALQWRPDEATELILEGTYSRFKRHRDLAYYQLLLNDNDVIGSTTALPDGTVSKATLTGITLRPLAYDAPSDLKSYNFGLSGKRSVGAFTFTADTSYSRGEGSENQAGLSTGAPFTYVIVPRAGNTVDVSYDFANRDFPNYSLSSNFNRDDPAQYRLFSVFDGVARSENRGYDGRFDLKYEAHWGPLTSLQSGARYEDIRLTSADPQSTPGAADLLAVADHNHDGIITLDELPAVSYQNQLGGNFFSEASGSFPRSFLTGDVLSVAQARRDVGLGDPARAPASERNVDQRTPAAYLRANFSGNLFSLPYSANLGVRYVSTRRTARGNAVATLGSTVTITPTELTKDFSQWLPSGNIAFNLADDLLLRLAASKVVARPALRDVAPGITVSLTTFTATAGTPDLKPIEANQYDATLEWYLAEASLLSVALYKKDLSTFIISTTSVETLDGYPPSAVNPSGLFQVNRPRNGTGGRVQGFEIGYQHAFKFLPSPFDGFGVVTNYTYADSETPIQDPLGGGTLPLSNLSRDSYNLVGYYENNLFTVRVAYTYRSKFLAALDSAALGGARYEDKYGQLDASASLAVSDRCRLTFDATNLTKAITRQYNGTWSRLTAASVNDTRYTVGITASF